MAVQNASTTSAERKARGDAGERRAREFLEAQGLACLDAGWRCRLGELDLVMRHGDVLVFVEVRARQAGALVGAAESVGTGKQRRVANAARAWLARHPAHAALPARFDVLAFNGDDVDWLRDAFRVEEGPRSRGARYR